jgi:hypothetical protein
MKLTLQRGTGRRILAEYGETLRDYLDDFSPPLRHHIVLRVWQNIASCSITFVCADPRSVTIETVDEMYPSRPCPGIKKVDSDTIEFTHPLSVWRWSNVDAFHDSTAVISYVLSERIASD